MRKQKEKVYPFTHFFEKKDLKDIFKQIVGDKKHMKAYSLHWDKIPTNYKEKYQEKMDSLSENGKYYVVFYPITEFFFNTGKFSIFNKKGFGRANGQRKNDVFYYATERQHHDYCFSIVGHNRYCPKCKISGSEHECRICKTETMYIPPNIRMPRKNANKKKWTIFENLIRGRQ